MLGFQERVALFTSVEMHTCINWHDFGFLKTACGA